MRIVHLSDLHFWHITLNPARLAGKRMLGMSNLILNPARRYRTGMMPALRDRIKELRPDHILITGDLTTTSLEEEFAAAFREVFPLNGKHTTLTVIPGNHDRYTRPAARLRLFERHFGEFAPSEEYPWIRHIGESTAILGLDVSRPTLISARGMISSRQIEKARRLLEKSHEKTGRLIVACHYPVVLPDGLKADRLHGLLGREILLAFLAQLGPHLYCHGHIHSSWAFTPPALPQALCLNPGAALKKRKNSGIDLLLLEILFEGEGVEVRRHALRRGTWETERLVILPEFFAKEAFK
jgi:3',5'-cyclic AMP phosphodiesterase CpdA